MTEPDTFKRETDGLIKLSSAQSIKRMMVVIKDISCSLYFAISNWICLRRYMILCLLPLGFSIPRRGTCVPWHGMAVPWHRMAVPWHGTKISPMHRYNYYYPQPRLSLYFLTYALVSSVLWLIFASQSKRICSGRKCNCSLCGAQHLLEPIFKG